MTRRLGALLGLAVITLGFSGISDASAGDRVCKTKAVDASAGSRFLCDCKDSETLTACMSEAKGRAKAMRKARGRDSPIVVYRSDEDITQTDNADLDPGRFFRGSVTYLKSGSRRPASVSASPTTMAPQANR